MIGDDLLGQSSGGSTAWLLYDGHGSTRALSGREAQDQPTITARYSFDAYGMMLGGDPTLSKPAATDLLYSGEQFDAGLQQQYLRARYYEQKVGGFASLDPFGGSIDEPQSLNKYAYCHGNPANRFDPSGLYEADFHLYLTVYLARQAGFPDDLAWRIGYATQELDKPGDPRNAMACGFLPRTENFARYHFPTEFWYRMALQRSDTWAGFLNLGSTTPEFGIAAVAVGEALHVAADTYGHSTGTGDRNWQYYGDLHFAGNGGYAGHGHKGHNPDHTWKRPGMAMKAANEVFRLCRIYARQAGFTSLSSNWDSATEGRVMDFVNFKPNTYTEYYGGIIGFENVSVQGLKDKISILDPAFASAIPPYVLDAHSRGRTSLGTLIARAWNDVSGAFAHDWYPIIY